LTAEVLEKDAPELENDAQKLKNYIVGFINPVTKLRHSTHKVAASNPVEAVEQAVQHAALVLRGTEIPMLSTYDTTVTDEHGQPIKGLGTQVSKAQLIAQLAQIQQQLGMLDDDGETPAQKAAVSGTLGNTPRVVAAPEVNEAGFALPIKNTPPESTTVTQAQAPKPNAGTFTQDQVDAMIKEAQAKTGQVN
jgi:hypothetical protein